MGTEVDKRDAEVLERQAEGGAVMPVRRIGSGIGLATIGFPDLLALEDITTAGAWMPEIGFVIASIPALIVLRYYASRRRDRAGPGDEGSGQAEGPEAS